MITSVVHADSLEAQRQRYQQILSAWDSNQQVRVVQLLPGLRDYPLYPYLVYRQLIENLNQQSSETINRFIASYPTLPAARSLPAQFVNELARREDWQGLLSFAPQPPESAAARCNWYYAKWATGQQQQAWQGAQSTWLQGQSQPASCDKLFDVWQGAGQQTALMTLERIRLALKEDNGSLVMHLVKQLPDEYATMSDAIIQLQKDPATVASFAQRTGPTPFTRQATILAFKRLARSDAEQARSLIPSLIQRQKMDESEAQQLKESVAWRLMSGSVTTEQARWRDNVIMRSEDSALIERRVRIALGDNDRRGLNTWIARLPVETKGKDEWMYWQADLLLEKGRKQLATQLLQQLMAGRGFYPMVAAQRLGEGYVLRVNESTLPSDSLTQSSEMGRVRELMYWGKDNMARAEWRSLIISRPVIEQQQLAHYARVQNWWDLSVQATIAGRLWDQLGERFPLAFQPEFNKYIAGKTIARSYAMAIARQESAWNPEARSPVGATGLMQLMPATAQHTVKISGISGYSSSNQLLVPDINIQIGTQYLDSVYQQFDSNRILASAAYNAGPSRVKSWLNNSAGRLNAVAFIESIPFSETRNYVKNVLAYDFYYQCFMDKPDRLLTSKEWNRRY
ncbi:MAG: Soluble lytic murein transglycosylase [Candidatus Erwinia impunctatus]|nr:Soluble lytic murein transglycosylase [Culicoides impunctatus]